MRALLPAGLLLLLAVPFDPFWIDFETARRGGLLLAAAAILACSWRRLVALRDPAFLALAGLAAWHAVRSVGVPNELAGLQRAALLAALACVHGWALDRGVERWARAALAVGVVVCSYGLAQSLGLAWPPGYGGPSAPVSTLGNLNFASELAAIVGAVLATALALGNPRVVPVCGLALATAYLVVNGSRSGPVALGIATAAIVAARAAPVPPHGPGRPQGPKRRRLVLLAALLGGLGVGGLAWLARPEPPKAATTPAAGAADRPSPSTIQVRLEIAGSCLRMAGDAPILGHGSAQMPVFYPRYRSAREIELSTYGRRFRAMPESAHDDHLQILVETGIVGLALWLAFLVLAARGAWRRWGVAGAATLAAFAALALVRSPLGNAPVAVLALAASAALARAPERARVAPGWVAIPAWALAAALAWLGAGQLLSQHAAARYQRARAQASTGTDRLGALRAAVSWNPADTRLRALYAQELARSGAAAAREAVLAQWAEVERRDPYNTDHLFLHAEAAHRLGDPVRALRLLERLLGLDPEDPEATLLLATIHARMGRPLRAIATLYAHPHPRLRARLAGVLDELAALAERQGDPRAARLYRREQAFVHALDVLTQRPLSREANDAVAAFLRLERDDPSGDPRPNVLLAVQWVHLGKPDEAAKLAPRGTTVQLAAPHRRLMAPLLARLRGIPAWRRALGGG